MKKTIKILKIILKSIAIVLVLIFLLLAISIPYGKSTENDMPIVGISYDKIVLKGLNVLSMETDSVLYNKNLYISNNKIVDITPDSIINRGFEVINADNKFVMPGLIDMHAHIFDRTDLPQYLSYGVTTVRNMMGFPMHLRWKHQLKENALVGSKLITASPTINSGDNAGPFHKTVNNTSEATEAVENYINEGYDFIKVYDDVDSLQMKAIEKSIASKNVYIAGHPPKMSLNGLLQSEIVSIEHTEELLNFLDQERSEESIRVLAKQIKASNKAVTLNLLAFNRINRISQEGNSYYESLQKEYLNPVTKFIGTKQLVDYTQAGSKYKLYAETKFKAMENLSRILVEEGVPVLLGTDSGPNFIAAGVSVLEEMQLLENAGVPRFEILKSATINAGEILNKKDLGRIAKNATADLLVFNENPLKSLNVLSSPNMLFTNSKYYSNNDMLEIRTIGEDKQNTYATIGLFLEHLINK
jgi:hypothetical protein